MVRHDGRSLSIGYDLIHDQDRFDLLLLAIRLIVELFDQISIISASSMDCQSRIVRRTALRIAFSETVDPRGSCQPLTTKSIFTSAPGGSAATTMVVSPNCP